MIASCHNKRGVILKNIFLFLFLFISITILPQNNIIDYYPIKVGYEWKYKAPGKDYEEKFIVSEFDETYDAYLIKHIVKVAEVFPITNEELIEKRNGKVLLLGTHGGVLNNWSFFAKNIIFKSDLKVGQSWENNDEDEGEIDEYKVLGFSDVVVPAGEFKNVLVLQITSIDSESKKKKVIMKRKLYYAPNVGLIKTEFFSSEENIYKIFTELADYEL